MLLLKASEHIKRLFVGCSMLLVLTSAGLYICSTLSFLCDHLVMIRAPAACFFFCFFFDMTENITVYSQCANMVRLIHNLLIGLEVKLLYSFYSTSCCVYEMSAVRHIMEKFV
jgi:hypothetical protein